MRRAARLIALLLAFAAVGIGVGLFLRLRQDEQHVVTLAPEADVEGTDAQRAATVIAARLIRAMSDEADGREVFALTDIADDGAVVVRLPGWVDWRPLVTNALAPGRLTVRGVTGGTPGACATQGPERRPAPPPASECLTLDAAELDLFELTPTGGGTAKCGTAGEVARFVELTPEAAARYDGAVGAARTALLLDERVIAVGAATPPACAVVDEPGGQSDADGKVTKFLPGPITETQSRDIAAALDARHLRTRYRVADHESERTP